MAKKTNKKPQKNHPAVTLLMDSVYGCQVTELCCTEIALREPVCTYSALKLVRVQNSYPECIFNHISIPASVKDITKYTKTPPSKVPKMLIQ